MVNRPFATLDDVDDLVRNERGPVLFSLADLRQTDVRQVPLSGIYLSEFFVSCGGDDSLKDLDEIILNLAYHVVKRRLIESALKPTRKTAIKAGKISNLAI